MSKAEAAASESTCEVTIRFPQVDPAGIVFYPRYFEMVQRCFPDVPFAQTPAGVKTQFLKPNRFGDNMELAYERGAEWSISGRMDGSTCFSMTPLDIEDSAAAFREAGSATFATESSAIGPWCLGANGKMQLSRYFEFLNMAIEEWFESVLNLPFADLHVGRRIGIPTVQFDTRAYSLPGSGGSVAIRIKPIRVGGRALTFKSWLVDDKQCFVENEQVVVLVKMLAEGFESIEIPDYIRSAFAEQMDKAQ